MSRVLIVATSRDTRGGITAVIKAHEKGEQWKKFHCHWIQTHRDGPNWRKILYLVGAFADYLIRLPFYDIVHVHFSLQTTAKRKRPFVRLAKLFGKKVIVHLHCGSQIDDIWNEDYTYLFSSADVSLALSECLRKKVMEHMGRPIDIRVCYNPCPIICAEPVLPKKNYILFSGTLYEGKGYLDLIRAFGKIAASFPDWKLVLAGNGEVDRGKALASDLGISSRVEFLGWVNGDQKDMAFREASVFCLPSYAEGFPMAVLDAWSYGLPVITTPVGGIPDVAIDGVNMLLFEPGDVSTLADQLARMLDDADLRDRIASESSCFASGLFNLSTINTQLYNLYSELSR